MTSPPADGKPVPRYSRRIAWLGIGVIILCMVYTAGWFYLAQRIEGETRTALAALQGSDSTAECVNPVARGYPFRIGLFCDSVSFTRPADGVSLTAGAFRSAGQIYDPRRLVAELDGPATVTAPAIGQLALAWENLRASVRLAEPLPERASVEGRVVKVAGADGTPLASAGSFEGHMRPNGADIDLAASFESLAVDPALVQGRTLPALSGEADIGVVGGVAMLAQDQRDLRGRSGTIRRLALSLGPQGGVELSGPFAVDEAGLLDADFTVAVREPQALAATLSAAFPEAARQIGQAFMGLALLGNSPSLPLKVSKGNAVLGFIPLGKVPPLQ